MVCTCWFAFCEFDHKSVETFFTGLAFRLRPRVGSSLPTSWLRPLLPLHLSLQQLLNSSKSGMFHHLPPQHLLRVASSPACLLCARWASSTRSLREEPWWWWAEICRQLSIWSSVAGSAKMTRQIRIVFPCVLRKFRQFVMVITAVQVSAKFGISSEINLK